MASTIEITQADLFLTWKRAPTMVARKEAFAELTKFSDAHGLDCPPLNAEESRLFHEMITWIGGLS